MRILKFFFTFCIPIFFFGCSFEQILNQWDSKLSSSQELSQNEGDSLESSSQNSEVGGDSVQVYPNPDVSNTAVYPSIDVPPYLSRAPMVGFVKLNLEKPVDFNKIANSNFYGAKIYEEYVVWEVSGDEMLDLIAWWGFDELEGVYDKQSLKFKFALAKNGTLWLGIEGSKEAILSYMSHPYVYSGFTTPYILFAREKGLTDQEIAEIIRNWDLNKNGLIPALGRMAQLLIYNKLISYASDRYTIEKDNFQYVRIKDFYFLEKGIKNNMGDLVYICQRIVIWDKDTYGDFVIPMNLAWSPLSTHTSTGSGRRGFTLVYKKIPKEIAFSIYAHSDNGNSAYAQADSYKVEQTNWYPGHAKFIYGYAPEDIELGASIIWSVAHSNFVMVYIGSPDDVTWTNVWQDPPGGLSNNPPPIKGVIKKGWNFYKYTHSFLTSSPTTYKVFKNSFKKYLPGSLPDGFVIIYDGKDENYQSVVDAVSYTDSKS